MRKLAQHVPWMQLLRKWLKQAITDKEDAVVDGVLRVLDAQAPPPAEVIKKSQIGSVVGDLSHKVFSKKKKKTSEHVADGACGGFLRASAAVRRCWPGPAYAPRRRKPLPDAQHSP